MHAVGLLGSDQHPVLSEPSNCLRIVCFFAFPTWVLKGIDFTTGSIFSFFPGGLSKWKQLFLSFGVLKEVAPENLLVSF